jgi:FkbM family methyltransferase
MQSAAHANNDFRSKLFEEIFRDCYEFQENNTDFVAFRIAGVEKLKRRLKDKLLGVMSSAGFVRRRYDPETLSQVLLATVDRLEGLERTYHRLQDDHSRQILRDVLRLRLLGRRHVKLPINNERFWTEYNSVDARFLKKRRTIAPQMRWDFNLYELPENGTPVKLHSNPLGILQTFVLEQYAYRRISDPISAGPGDIVIDGGGCWGDTTLYFAAKVGSAGKVYVYEFESGNLDVLRQNLDLNEHLKDSVRIVENALWDKSGEVLTYDPGGPATTIALRQTQSASAPAQTTTLSIDDLVHQQSLPKVDFIKMDIEGAELNALKGAEQSLRAFRPSLAISVYHRDDDWVTIPDYLDSLDLGYEFFLDHFTIYESETVLFARSPQRPV